jgi:predicted DNA-binding transcriptional regulator AlpA
VNDSWRLSIRAIAEAIPPDKMAEAIGELEAAKAQLYARLANGRVSSEEQATRQQTKATESDQLLTAEEAAKLLGVTRRWLYDKADSLPFIVRLSPRTLRFSEKGIQRYIARK